MKKLFLVLLLSAQSASFAVTGNKVWRVPSGGSLPSWGPVNLADGTNAVTGLLPRGNLPTVGQQVSSSSGTFSTGSSSFVDVTNLSISLTTSGRPVIAFLQGVDTGAYGAGYIGSDNGGDAVFRLLRGATVVGVSVVFSSTVASAFPPGSLLFFDAPSSGTYTYKLQAKKSSGTGGAAVQDCKLIAYEL